MQCLGANMQWMYPTGHLPYKFCSCYCYKKKLFSLYTLSLPHRSCALCRKRSAEFQTMNKGIACLWRSGAELAELTLIYTTTEVAVFAESFHKKKQATSWCLNSLLKNQGKKIKITEHHVVSLLIYTVLIFESRGHDPSLLSPTRAQGSL